MSTMNLLPDYYVKKRYRNRVNLVCVVLFAVVMAVIIGAELLLSGRDAKIQSEYAEVDEEFTKTADFLKKDFFQLQGQKQAMLREAQAVAEREDRIPRSYVLAVITNVCTENLSFREILLTTIDPNKQVSKKRAVKRITSETQDEEEKPKLPLIIEVKLQGEAQKDSDVTNLFSALKSHPLMKKVDLKYIREEGSDTKAKRLFSSGNKEPGKIEPLREFAIHMELHSQIDMIKIISRTDQTKPLNSEKKIAQKGGSK